MEISKTLSDKFFTDPDWKHVEELLLSYIEPLKDINGIDIHASGADVKGELKARKKLYGDITKFLQDTKIISRPKLPSKNAFI